MYEDSYCKKTTIKKNHLVTLSGYSTTPKHGDEDDDRAGDDDDAPIDMIHTGGEAPNNNFQYLCVTLSHLVM